jgi:hypothetical protein
MSTKFHPILFSTPMVHAILEGRKTQTRRTKGLEKINITPDLWRIEKLNSFFAKIDDEAGFDLKLLKSPYNVGDVFWVRETFTEWPKGDFQFYASTALGEELGKWKPSIHMPKEACRIFLKIKSIRVERLQDISWIDADSEGVKNDGFFEGLYNYLDYLQNIFHFISPIRSFMTLWQSINGKESWDTNPFVWVYEFEQIEKPLDFLS